MTVFRDNSVAMKNALVTACNEEYIEGTKVLFHSFLKHNPKFNGDLVIIHDKLPLVKQKEITDLFDVHFVNVCDELLESIQKLVGECIELKNRQQRFWSLEAFNLKQYKNVLFMDSDILCKGPLDKLFALTNGFSACPDLSFYEGMSRDRDSFQKVVIEKKSQQNIHKVFNSGVFSLCFSKLPSSTYKDLLNLLKGSIFSEVKSGHTDQYMLNLYFENKVNYLKVHFNYLLNKIELIEDKTGVSASEAIVFHYIRQPKPWNLKKLVKNRLTGKHVPAYWSEWHKAFRKILRLNNKIKFQVKNSFKIVLSKVLFP